MVWSEPYFLLIFGHLYNGLYTAGGGGAQQEYSESVRAFHFNFNPEQRTFQINYVGQVPFIDPLRPNPGPEGPYHHRDLTVLPVLSPAGQPRIAALGGMFKGGRFEGYVHPVYIWNDHANLLINMNEDQSTEQLLSQYMVATIPIYSKKRQAMYTTFFGGISQYHWDEESQSLKQDKLNFQVSPPIDGLPFINSVSTLKVAKDGSAHYLHKGETFPPDGGQPSCGEQVVNYLGAETVFVANEDVAMEYEVIQLDAMRRPQEIGYLVGGIAATKPYPGAATCASPKVYRVTLDPCHKTASIELQRP